MSRFLPILLCIPLLANSSGMGMAAAVLAAQQAGYPTSGLVFYLPFDADANDISPNGLTGSYIGDAVVSGGVADFDGDGDAINYGDNLDDVFSGVGAMWTIAAWTNHDVLNTRHVLIGKREDPTNNRQFFVEKRDNNKIRVVVSGILNNGNSYTLYEGSTVLTAGSWYHIAVSWDQSLTYPNRVKIYVNGDAETVSVTQGPSSVTSIPDGAAPLAIGGLVRTSNLFYALPMDGKIDDVLVYDRVFSAAEITAIYNLRSDLHP